MLNAQLLIYADTRDAKSCWSGSDKGQEEAVYVEGSQDIRARASFAATSIFNAAAIRSR